MYRLILVAGFSLLLSLRAHATANVGCDIDDGNLRLTMSGLAGRAEGSPIFDLKASAELRSPQIPAKYKQLSLENDVHQMWTSGEDFKIRFHREVDEQQSYVTLDLRIETTQDPEADDLSYKGTYALSFTSHDVLEEARSVMVQASGSATCYDD